MDRSCYDQLPCGVFELNEAGSITYVNKELLAMCGASEETLLGQGFDQLKLHRRGVENIPVCIRECMAESGDDIVNRHLFLDNCDGESVPVYLSGRWSRQVNHDHRAVFCLMEISKFENCLIEQQQEGEPRHTFFNLVGKDAQMQTVYQLIELTAATNVSVVIEGESGTGKELVAAAIHKNSDRKSAPFVRVNCSALTESLLESELFGHVKGSFTGAYKDRVGRFEEAQGGTVFLDEIGEISPAIQVKLLNVLQERVITRVGDNREIEVDVRIIAATNKSLRKLVNAGRFREDLFYRLNVFPIHTPPLRERKNDIALLSEFFMEKFRKRTGKAISRLAPDALRMLIGYCWPGNVRELENCIEHAFVLCQGHEISALDLPHEIRVAALRDGICQAHEQNAGAFAVAPLETRPRKQGGRLNISKEALLKELERHSHNRSATADSLGISTVALWKKMKKFELI